MKKLLLWGVALILASPLHADTVPSPEQYNQMTRETIGQCSRVDVRYGFVDFQVGPDSISVGSIGLTPRDATFLANAISVSHRIIDPPGIGVGSRWLDFFFYDGKKIVGVASANLPDKDGSIILQGWNQSISDYYLTTQSAKTLRDWVLKQPQLAKKFPH